MTERAETSISDDNDAAEEDENSGGDTLGSSKAIYYKLIF